jgi:acetyl-CoA acetyltransferase
MALPDKAKELSTDPSLRIRVLSVGQARTSEKYMPAAPVPAAQNALDAAGLTIDEIDCVKTHNPFVVNDIVFARETGWDVLNMNNYGSSLVWGHPNGPTGMRSVIELIEELKLRGGGKGLFTGCAAGDLGMAVVVDVDQRPIN